MRQPIWNLFEVALLIDAYLRIENGHITKKMLFLRYPHCFVIMQLIKEL